MIFGCRQTQNCICEKAKCIFSEAKKNKYERPLGLTQEHQRMNGKHFYLDF
ncbi:uncharacterized protein CELE_R107.9 [Caenorhabditis elegans]|uniref:Uncharacterized protein n=1 Tax=Caenorhabditis elegans TaxID=6239 RepID=D1MN59_CAEEL|nr:Uncharacterized protein CELE_R107.9 [Caenorhabditis elegans]CBI63232.1 Uncharacterized protein CELE_R107.9 [Caenorhabditis elegans]|eukprot:NP_001254975.1 Uncharacterized protein CELE_R107.9 [Caenorhabditis elegans]